MSQNTREKIVASLKDQIDEIDGKMEALGQKSEKLESDARAEYDERLTELRQARRKAQQRMEEARDAGEEQWEEIKDDAEHAWKALRNSFNYFKSHFK